MSIQTIVVLVIAVILMVSLVIFYSRSASGIFSSIGVLGGVGQNSTATAAEEAASVIEGLG